MVSGPVSEYERTGVKDLHEELAERGSAGVEVKASKRVPEKLLSRSRSLNLSTPRQPWHSWRMIMTRQSI